MLAQELPTNFVHLTTHENYMADVLSRLEYTNDGEIKINALADINIDENEHAFMSMQAKPKISSSDFELLEYYKRLHRNFHWSVDKTVKSLSVYGIPINKELILESWLECPNCQKLKRASPVSKLKFRETPSLPMDEIHIDHIIKKDNHRSIFGHNAAITVKCSLTRYFVCFPVKDVKIRNSVDMLQNFFMSVGRSPKKIYADNAFDAVSMHEFCKRHNIEISFRPSNMSRSVSVESTHRRLHEKIASLLGTKNASYWHEVVWQAALSLNCQPSSSTGYTPYYLFYGHSPRYLGSHETPTNVEMDKWWLYDLKIAKHISDSKRLATSSDHVHPTFKTGQKIKIRTDNSKHATCMSGEIVADKGGATALIKLQNRSKPLLFHKGHIYAEKYSEAWKLYTIQTGISRV